MREDTSVLNCRKKAVFEWSLYEKNRKQRRIKKKARKNTKVHRLKNPLGVGGEQRSRDGRPEVVNTGIGRYRRFPFRSSPHRLPGASWSVCQPTCSLFPAKCLPRFDYSTQAFRFVALCTLSSLPGSAAVHTGTGTPTDGSRSALSATGEVRTQRPPTPPLPAPRRAAAQITATSHQPAPRPPSTCVRHPVNNCVNRRAGEM